ncbi:MAG: prepilin-type N-terminal cleavage/methylation domain-containing protein [Kiritimatiellae bacterium]|nr:prepilin-type N-terminal cleavage/methylation domain-containing protein [Kiritimatiellia bacterium]
MSFTLIELLVALTILVTAMTIIWGTFSTTVNAWRRGGELLDDLHHGDFVMEQLVSALRSAAFFATAPHKYGFRMEDGGSGLGAGDEFSWVASGSTFIPKESPLAQGLHRLVVTVEPNDDGVASFAVRAYPHLADEDKMTPPDPWYISSVVKGIDCRTYNVEDEAWEDRWEDTNALPSVVEVTLYMEPIEEYGDPVTIRRLVEIPVAPVVTQAVKWAESGVGARGEKLEGGVGAGAGGGSSRDLEIRTEK